jgi:hypothetical protein
MFRISEDKKRQRELITASRLVISPVINGRRGLFILSTDISNKSLRIILFDIMDRVMRELIKNEVDLYICKEGFANQAPVFINKIVGRIF